MTQFHFCYGLNEFHECLFQDQLPHIGLLEQGMPLFSHLAAACVSIAKVILAGKYVISQRDFCPGASSLIQLNKDFPASWYLLTKVFHIPGINTHCAAVQINKPTKLLFVS